MADVSVDPIGMQCRYKAVSFTGLKPYGERLVRSNNNKDLKRLFGSRVFNIILNDVVLVADHFPAFLSRVINAHQVLCSNTCVHMRHLTKSTETTADGPTLPAVSRDQTNVRPPRCSSPNTAPS